MQNCIVESDCVCEYKFGWLTKVYEHSLLECLSNHRMNRNQQIIEKPIPLYFLLVVTDHSDC